MAASPKQNFIKSVLGEKKRIEGGLQSVGRNIRSNIAQGDADWKSGKMPYYGTINPLKGTVSAFKQGFDQ